MRESIALRNGPKQSQVVAGIPAAERHRSFVPADDLDELASVMLPPEIVKRPARLMHVEAESLFADGLRGPTGRSLLSKDLAASRAHLRYFSALLDHEVDRLGRNKGDIKRAKFFSDLVERQHRRLVATAELLLRLDTAAPPTFRIEADQAAFVVGGPTNSRNNDNG